jgi:phosphatidylglycerophosphate synthase
MRSSRPSIAELRAVAQPASLFARNSGEHWAGRLYMRRVSPYLTRLLLPLPVSANALTWLMIPVGLLAALGLTLPGLPGAVVAVVLVQLQLLLDCSDGEVARWRRTFAPVGIYADRLAHHVTDAALSVALGIRADGGWAHIGGWTTLGLLVATLGLLVKAEATLVHVARAASGLPVQPDTAAAVAPRARGLARLRRALRFAPFFRAFVAIEASLLALAAAVVDVVTGDLTGTRALLAALVPVALITLSGRLLAIVSSGRLR